MIDLDDFLNDSSDEGEGEDGAGVGVGVGFASGEVTLTLTLLEAVLGIPTTKGAFNSTNTFRPFLSRPS